MSKVRPAEAHDAGCLGVLCPNYAQLMLMMLALLGFFCPKYAQLMLMMLAAWGFCVQRKPS